MVPTEWLLRLAPEMPSSGRLAQAWRLKWASLKAAPAHVWLGAIAILAMVVLAVSPALLLVPPPLYAGTVGGLPLAVILGLIPAAVALFTSERVAWAGRVRRLAATIVLLSALALLLGELDLLPTGSAAGWLKVSQQMRNGPVSLFALVIYLLALSVAIFAADLRLPVRLVIPLQAASGIATAVCGIGWLLLGIGAAAFGAAAIVQWTAGWAVLTAVALAWNLRLLRSQAKSNFVRERPDRMILMHNLTALAAASYAAGLIATGVFAINAVGTIEPLLLQGTLGHAAALQHQLNHLASEAKGGISRINDLGDPASVTNMADKVRRALAAHGPPEVQVIRGDVPMPGFAVPVLGPSAISGWLASIDGARVQFLVDSGHGERIAITFTARNLSPLLDFRVLDLHADTLVCSPLRSDAAQCLTGAGVVTMPLPSRSDGREWPMRQAWTGKSGVMLTLDRFGHGVAVAFVPVPGWNLGVAHKLNVSALLRSLSARVMLAVAILGAFSVAIARLVFRRSHSAVRELRFAKAYVDATIDALPQTLLTLDAEQRIQRASGSAQSLLGVSPASLCGRTLASLFESSAMPRLDESASEEAVIAREDGSHRVVEVVCRRMQFEGRVDQIVIFRDISTERRHLESLQRWEAIFQQAGWGAVVFAVEDERIELTNAAFAALYGCAPEKLIGVPFGDLFMEGSAAEYRRAGQRSQGDRLVLAARHRRCDGSSFPALVDTTVLRSPDGSPQARVAVVQDLTELHRAELESRDARMFFERTFDTAPVGMLVADCQGRLLRTNPALRRFVDHSANELSQRPLADLVAPAQRAIAQDLMRASLDGIEARHATELPFLRRDGSWAWGLLVVARVQAINEEVRLVGQLLDVDESRRIREALKESESSLSQAEQMAHLGHWRWTPGDDTVRCSQQALRILGFGDDESPTRPLSELVLRAHPDDLRSLRSAIERTLAEGPDVDIDHRIVRPDGSERLVHQTARVVPAAGDRALHVLWTIQDITDSKTIENELRNSRQALRDLLANDEGLLEEERKRIAREIHDELGQLLTALRMDVSMLRLASAERPEVLALSARMLAKIDETIAVMRHVASHLRPASLDIGLIPALEWLVEDFSHRWEIQCELSHAGVDQPVSDMVATAAFRMVQECLTNVARHACAETVGISIEMGNQRLRVTVTDDGLGFDPGAARQRGCFGLLGMHERALKAGGVLEILSSPGRGTRVLIELVVD